MLQVLALRWFRRYKIFFLIGFLIIGIQIFLAYKSLKLPLLSNFVPTYPRTNEQIVLIEEPNSLLTFDDEDIHSNSNILSKSKNTLDIPLKKLNKSTLNDLSFTPSCDIKLRETISAVHRAKTQGCKKHIIDIACAIQDGTLYPKRLSNSCPNGKYQPNRALGCYKDEKKYRLLSGYYTNFKAVNSPRKCISMCLQSGFIYAGVQYS